MATSSHFGGFLGQVADVFHAVSVPMAGGSCDSNPHHMVFGKDLEEVHLEQDGSGL